MAEHEIKFVLENSNAAKLTGWLEKKCAYDPRHARGVVSSIYYDTPDWQYLFEKFNSDFLKSKFRLRWYEDPFSRDFSPCIYLERKLKIGSSRKKYRMEFATNAIIREARFLNDGFFLSLPYRVLDNDILPLKTIFPAFQISYTRLRFVDPLSGARISIDSDIHVPRINPVMVGKGRPQSLNTAVLELKSNETGLPEWLHTITAMGCRKSSFSKYSACFEHITGYNH